MGKSSKASCFKLIGCSGGGEDSVDKDDLQSPEVKKGSSDGRKWSLRKRSARHRVLSNSVVSETSSGNKASPNTATVSFQSQSSSPIPEKSSEPFRTEEKTKAPEPETELSETVDATNANIVTINHDESTVIIIQAAIRGFLAHRMFLKQKNIIKLQAAIRGHIVRNHAVGSLRCVQAIVKMQALIRRRRTRILLEESRNDGNQGKMDQRNGKENHCPIPQASIEKLLRNSFVCQLLESKSSTKSINFKCDPLKYDSAWKWLERWMSAASTGNGQSLTFESTVEQKKEECLEISGYHLSNVIGPGEGCPVIEAKLTPQNSVVSSESDEDMITHEVLSHESDGRGPSLSSSSDDLSKPCYNNVVIQNYFDKAPDSLAVQTTESKFVSEVDTDSLENQSEMENKKYTDSLNQSLPEEPETNGKKLKCGSTHASDPAFIAAQSKFEDLCLEDNSGKSVALPDEDAVSKLLSDAVSLESNFRTMEIIPAESSLPPTSFIEVGGSECGTELSISSTLDSPDRHDVGLSNVEKETAALEDANDYNKNPMSFVADVQVQLPSVEKDLSCSNSVVQERRDNNANTDIEHDDPSAKDVISSLADKISEASETDVRINLETEVNHQASKHSPEVSPKSHVILPDSQDDIEHDDPSAKDVISSLADKISEASETDVRINLETEVNHQASKHSPEVSPKSHVILPDSQDTPSSNVSLKPKKVGTGKSGRIHKHSPGSSGKKYHSDPSHGSSVRNSTEQLPKNHTAGRRRDSFGSARTDHGSSEPRVSSSSNSLPSYMQATESARAKAVANNSPRSSPDVMDKDYYVKKRHSLPGSNTKQGSPRVQLSFSQSPQTAKPNGIHSPQERKWRR